MANENKRDLLTYILALAAIQKAGKSGGTIPTTTELLKGDGSGSAVPAVPGEDYVTPEGAGHPYLSLIRRDTYLYDVSFGTIPPDAGADLTPGGACSSFVRGGKLYRNMDWDYDELATFHMVCPGFEGCAFLSGLTASALNDDLIGQLPYHICDGRNDHGIMMATHVLYNDWGATGSGEIPLTKLPYLVLSRVKSMATLETDLDGVLDNLYVPPAMAAAEYLIQILVTDGVTTNIIRPGNSEAATYEVVDATENPKLTNFRWVADTTVSRADLQLRPTGVERWNMIPCELSDLRFTAAYESPVRLSEFIGIDGTTKDSTDAELTAIYDLAHAAYLTRTRDGSTWQTMHSAVYGSAGLEHLWIQEDWGRDFVGGGLIPKSAQSPKTASHTEPVGIDADGKLWSIPGSGSGSSAWGGITGDIDDQTDLSEKLAKLQKIPNEGVIAGGTVESIENNQYDAKYMHKQTSAVTGNLAKFDSAGQAVDSAIPANMLLFGGDEEILTKILSGVQKIPLAEEA